MSAWRKEASKQMPEFQPVIAARNVHTPRDLWMQLNFEFDRLMHERPVPEDLLRRFWKYAKWSLDQPNEEVQHAVCDFFFENLNATRNAREVCPSFMTPEEFTQFFEPHNPSPKGRKK